MTRSPLNLPILAAAMVFFLTALIHAFLGGPEVNAPVQESALDPVVRAVMAVAWHALTALFLALAAALAWAARRPNPALLLLGLVLSGSFVAIFGAIGIAQLGNVTAMPQWTLFAMTSVLLVWGLTRDRRAASPS